MPVAFEGRVGAYQTVDLDILRTTVGTGFTGWVAKHRTAIRVDDALTDPRGVTIPGTENVEESMLVVPMLHDDVLVGVVTLSKLGLNGFDEHDLRLLTTLADQAATAFMSTRHLAEADRLTAELRQLLDMSSALSRSLDPIAVADLMAQHLARAVGAGSAQISAWDKGEDRLRTLGCHPPEIRETVGDTYLLTGFPLTRKVLEERIIATVDVEDPDADAAEVALLRQEGHGGPADAAADRQGPGDRAGRADVRGSAGDRRRIDHARPDDGPRGGDGARERDALRDRPPAGRPRPADRVLPTTARSTSG